MFSLSTWRQFDNILKKKNKQKKNNFVHHLLPFLCLIDGVVLLSSANEIKREMLFRCFPHSVSAINLKTTDYHLTRQKVRGFTDIASLLVRKLYSANWAYRREGVGDASLGPQYSTWALYVVTLHVCIIYKLRLLIVK